ncbi:cyclopropane-fatty-acyl-phospholipid synthase [Solimonas aquatica]|uniref:Cyclopropane-fatty-acyl-phospholipid synthase n=1 Tax=Solimonas aquatica TaxID=489703 RepID=A0A1H9F7B7_9GAMM|nr:cyclopropane-fatty-acyl-phospholipid synthase family protein [Solimonas aquatica]SEQ33864.1 cyclopropane-fatty-acyl-phospholipid synthase [Solimonas aquatica]
MADVKLQDKENFDAVLARDGFSPELPAALAPGARTGLSLRLMLYMLKGLRIGSLDVLLPGGELRQFRGSEPGPHGVLQIRSAALIRHVLRGGEVGFGEAYLDGCWDSPDLASLLMVLYRNEPHYKGPYEKNPLGRLYGWLQHRLRANTRRGARENIRFHYDLGNDFYKLWLDETLAYSSAVFEAGRNETLAEAQRRKFALMAQRLHLKPEHHLLEIGSGWGGFALYAAQHYGCRVTSITLSEEQLAEARARAQAAGLSHQVHFALRDYRDVREQYDRVVSIEMYEAVGEAWWPAYFQTLQRALKPGGLAAIQGITISPAIFEEYRRKRDFIQKYIFPGGMLCPPGHFQDLAMAAGLKPEDPRFYGLDYAETLAIWHRNVLGAKQQVLAQFDERFLRMWRYYLAYCECGFRVGSIDLMQITLRREA